MGAAKRVREVEAAVVSLLLDAYQRRDRIAAATFGATGGDRRAAADFERRPRRAHALGGADRWPYAAGRGPADGRRGGTSRVRAEPQRRPLVVLITDGPATSGQSALARAPGRESLAGRRIRGSLSTRRTRAPWCASAWPKDFAVRLAADYLPLGEVAAPTLSRVVKANQFKSAGRLMPQGQPTTVPEDARTAPAPQPSAHHRAHRPYEGRTAAFGLGLRGWNLGPAHSAGFSSLSSASGAWARSPRTRRSVSCISATASAVRSKTARAGAGHQAGDRRRPRSGRAGRLG